MQLLTSCVDYLDKESDTELTLPMVFEDKTRTEGWLANVYSHVPDPYWGYARKLGWDILSDDMTASERWRQWDWKVIPMLLGEWTPSTDWDGNYWSRLPQLIREANIFIENVHPLPDQGISATEVTYMKAEMRFMIAYYYYLLSNTYGPVPFKPNYIAPTDFNLADLMEGQRPYYEVVDWVDKELKEVAEILPAKYTEARKYGRATSIMCLAVRARMLLFAASPLVNGNPDYANHKNKDGENLFSTTADKTKWAYAAQACKELIDAAEAAGHKLYTEKNDDGTIDPFMSYQNLFLTRYDEGNTEILFARPGGSEYGEYEKHATPAASGGSGGLGVTQSLVDAFFMENGLPINDDNSEYVETGYSVSDETRDNTVWDTEVNGGAISKKNTYNMYCHREPRFYITVSYNNSYFTQEKRVFNFFNGSADNPHTHDAPQNGYLIRKKISPDLNVKQGTYKYRPGIVYRLGEAYLNYAEALNEWKGGPTTDAYAAVNKVRKRGYTEPDGIVHSEYVLKAGMDQAEFRKAIQKERAYELAFEGHRRLDLIRWGIYSETIEETYNALKAWWDEREDDKNTLIPNYVIYDYTEKGKHELMPIPQREMDLCTQFNQNPKW